MDSILDRYAHITNYNVTSPAPKEVEHKLKVVLKDTRDFIPTVAVSPLSEGLITIHNLDDYRAKTTSIFLVPNVECLVGRILKDRGNITCIPTL